MDLDESIMGDYDEVRLTGLDDTDSIMYISVRKRNRRLRRWYWKLAYSSLKVINGERVEATSRGYRPCEFIRPRTEISRRMGCEEAIGDKESSSQ